MAKSNLDRLETLLKKYWPDKAPSEAYTTLTDIIREAGVLTRCKHQATTIIQKMDEMA